MTGNNVIIYALTQLGVVYPGQTISTSVQTIAQDLFNALLDEWNAQGLAIFSVIKSVYALTAAIADYSIGPGATGTVLGSVRPERVDAWATHSSLGSDGGKPVNAETFARMRQSIDDDALRMGLLSSASLSAARIKLLNYDAQYPFAMVHLYPVPLAGISLDLWAWEQFVAISDFTLPIAFPPGYARTLIFNLAVDLANAMGRECPQTTLSVANQCKQDLASLNVTIISPPPPSAAPPPVQR